MTSPAADAAALARASEIVHPCLPPVSGVSTQAELADSSSLLQPPKHTAHQQSAVNLNE